MDPVGTVTHWFLSLLSFDAQISSIMSYSFARKKGLKMQNQLLLL